MHKFWKIFMQIHVALRKNTYHLRDDVRYAILRALSRGRLDVYRIDFLSLSRSTNSLSGTLHGIQIGPKLAELRPSRCRRKRYFGTRIAQIVCLAIWRGS